MWAAVDDHFDVWLEMFGQFVQIAGAVEGTAHWGFEFAQMEMLGDWPGRVVPVVDFEKTQADVAAAVQGHQFIVGDWRVYMGGETARNTAAEIQLFELGGCPAAALGRRGQCGQPKKIDPFGQRPLAGEIAAQPARPIDMDIHLVLQQMDKIAGAQRVVGAYETGSQAARGRHRFEICGVGGHRPPERIGADGQKFGTCLLFGVQVEIKMG